MALVNCLNFGNPEHPEVMWQFSEVVDGMSDACRALELPVVGGNVSFYNETRGKDIDPTLVAGVVGEVAALIFGQTQAQTTQYAHTLGLAFQLTNIIRDVGEDALRGRIYLPMDELQQFHQELEDRFGKVPSQVEDLFDTLRCRKIAVALGFEKISLKDQTVKCFFVNKPDSPYFESPVFQGILAYIQHQTNRAHLKQTGRSFLLTVEGIGGMPDLLTFLQKMQSGVFGVPKEVAGKTKS